MNSSSPHLSKAIRLFSNLTSDGRGGILLFVSFGWFLTLGIRIIYPTLLPEIRSEFLLGYTTAGLLISVLWFVYALVQFPSGIVADRVGERRILALSVMVTITSVAGILLSSTVSSFILATVALGIGTGLYGTTRVTLLSAAYPKLDTTAISISQSAGSFGNIVLPLTAGVVTVHIGWRWGFGILLPFLVVTMIGLWISLPDQLAGLKDDSSMFHEVKQAVRVVRDRRVLLATLILFLNMIVYQSLTGFLPTYLIEIKQFSGETAATLFGLFFAAAICLQFVAGVLSDTWGRQYTMAAFLAASLPGFVLFTVVKGLLATIGAIALMSFITGAFPPAHSYVVRALPSTTQGSGYGLLRTFYIAFGAVGPFTFGVFADFGYFNEAFLLLGGVALITSGACLFLPRIN